MSECNLLLVYSWMQSDVLELFMKESKRKLHADSRTWRSMTDCWDRTVFVSPQLLYANAYLKLDRSSFGPHPLRYITLHYALITEPLRLHEQSEPLRAPLCKPRSLNRLMKFAVFCCLLRLAC
jgi:hypothetical protein